MEPAFKESSVQKFSYDTRRRQRQILGAKAGAGAIITLLLLCTPWEKTAQTYQTLGAAWAIGEASWPFLLLLSLGILPYSLQAPIRDALSRGRQEIETNSSGIRFRDGDQAIHASWSDITEYKAVERGGRLNTVSGFRVETRSGAFEFTSAITNYHRLHRIIDHWIPEAAREKPIPGEGVIGGEASLWTGGQVGTGDRIYHYRGRITQGLLLVYALFLLAPVFSGLVNGFDDLWRDKTIRVIEPLEYLTFAACLWAYKRTSVTVTDNALTQRSLLKTIVIPWEDVVSYKNEKDVRQVNSRNQQIRFSEPITDLAGLQAEIERRAMKSENKGWKTKNDE